MDNVKPVIVVFGYSRDRALFGQALRALSRLVAKGEACAVRLYDDANDPMCPGGDGTPQGVTRVETSWDRGGFRPGGYNEATVRGIVAAMRDAADATGAAWAVKTDCDAALNSLAYLDALDPAATGEFGNEGAKGFSMGVLHAFSAQCLERMDALLGDRKAQAQLVLLDRPEAQSLSKLAELTRMRRVLVPRDGAAGCGWQHSRHGFFDATPAQMDELMKCMSVFFKPTIPDGAPADRVEATYAAALRRMTAYVDALLERGDAMAPKPPPRTFSKLRLYAALSAAGLWDAFEAWLRTQTVGGVNAWTAFSLAQDLNDGHPLFGPLVESAKTALGVDDATAEAILAAAV